MREGPHCRRRCADGREAVARLGRRADWPHSAHPRRLPASLLSEKLALSLPMLTSIELGVGVSFTFFLWGAAYGCPAA